jgi:hypothetical protein
MGAGHPDPSTTTIRHTKRHALVHYEITPVPYVSLDGDELDPIADDYKIDQDQFWSAVGTLADRHEND